MTNNITPLEVLNMELENKQTMCLVEFAKKLLEMIDTPYLPEKNVFIKFYETYVKFCETRKLPPYSCFKLNAIFHKWGMMKAHAYDRDARKARKGMKLDKDLLLRMINTLGNHVTTSGLSIVMIDGKRYGITFSIRPFEDINQPARSRQDNKEETNN